RIVLDDENRAAAVGIFVKLALASHGRGRRLLLAERDFDGEDGALARSGTDIDGMAQQIAKPLHDGEAEAEAPAALPGGIVELMKLLEDRVELPVGDAGSGVPDLDAQRVAATAATDQYLAALGVFHRVRQEIADHLLE